MKLNIYINKLVRSIEKEKGKQKTRKLLKITRQTVFRWEKNYYPLNVDNLEDVSRIYCEIFPDSDLKEVFMQGLIALMEDRLSDLKKINN
jgi:DNA-binding XRE family transcriptional regulator